ncbi:hypothetical protein BKA66DRAFT_443924 [Pyrenochaeta sp. MPI-SDFR-AT-0127]|nr:hypothetical protein BKA66DRAFT_443924 [Pyrenochaeta sp. MPI-SDFR-AT-0127]
MAEALSVVGTAFGVVSLGIKVCEDLVTYIGHAKNMKIEVAHVVNHLEELETILEQLQSIVSSVSPTVFPRPSSAESGIAACGAALIDLRQKVSSHSSNGKPDGLMTQITHWRKHLLYPFKREDLLFLKDVVGGLQLNLIVALQALQLAQQDENHTRTSGDLVSLAQLTVTSTASVRCDIEEMQSNISDTMAVVKPIAVDIRIMMKQMTRVAASMTKLESRLNEQTIDNYAPRDIRKDIRNTHRLDQQLNNTDVTHTRTYDDCKCDLAAKTRTLASWESSWNFLISVKEMTSLKHVDTCTYSSFSTHHSSLQVRLSFCVNALRRKISLAYALHSKASYFNIQPSLRIHRIVPHFSKAFRRFAIRLGSLKPPFHKNGELLRNVFESREAMPHDRLANGTTLLHQFAEDVGIFWFYTDFKPWLHSALANEFRFLVRVMGDTAKERNDMGHFHLAMIGRPQSLDDINSLWSLIVSANSTWIAMCSLKEGSKEQDIMSVYLGKDARALQYRLDRGLDANTTGLAGAYGWVDGIPTELSFTALQLATHIGWRRGCEILLQNGAQIKHAKPTFSFTSFLINATTSGDKGTLRLWLDIRKTATFEDLHFIGNIETALMCCLQTYDTPPSADVQDLLVEDLKRQRKELEQISRIHLIRNNDRQRGGRVLDSTAWSTCNALESRGIFVSAWIRPLKHASIYHSLSPISSTVAEKFYGAGFKDVHVSDFKAAHRIIPPLIYNIMAVETLDLAKSLRLSEWFLSKGVTLEETWPDSTMATWAILAFQVGRYLGGRIDLGFGRFAEWDPELERIIMAVSVVQQVDCCSCPCSARGCSPLSSIIRGAVWYLGNRERLTTTKPGVQERLLIFFVTSWIAPAIRCYRSLSSVLFRSLSFWQLDLHHTCCNIPAIALYSDPHYTDLPYSLVYRYYRQASKKITTSVCKTENLDEIQKQDDFLREKLDILVLECDAAFREHKYDIVDFIMEVWSEKMQKLLQALTEEDSKKYSHERELLGVSQTEFDLQGTGIIGDIDISTEVGPAGQSLSELLPSAHTVEGLNLEFASNSVNEENYGDEIGIEQEEDDSLYVFPMGDSDSGEESDDSESKDQTGRFHVLGSLCKFQMRKQSD